MGEQKGLSPPGEGHFWVAQRSTSSTHTTSLPLAHTQKLTSPQPRGAWPAGEGKELGAQQLVCLVLVKSIFCATFDLGLQVIKDDKRAFSPEADPVAGRD